MKRKSIVSIAISFFISSLCFIRLFKKEHAMSPNTALITVSIGIFAVGIFFIFFSQLIDDYRKTKK